MRRGESGFTYVAVLALAAVLGIGLAALGTAWADDARREREQELLRVGALYAQAIADYRRVSPGSVKRWPATLDELVLDGRFVGIRRHLRERYADPLAPARAWGLVHAPDGGVMGVYSQSTEAPLRQASLRAGLANLPAARTYSDWKFVPEIDK